MIIFKFFLFFMVGLNCYALELSYTLVELGSKKLVTSKRAEVPQSLASVAKLYTTYYVLKNTDNNKTFETSIYIDGDINNYVLKGDLYLYPKGNPYVTIQDLISLIQQIKKNGIQAVKGRFFIVNDIGISIPRISSLGLEDQADNSSLGAFNVEFNRFQYLKEYDSFFPAIDYLDKKSLAGSANGLIFKHLKINNGQESWGVYKGEKKKRTEDVPARNSDLYGGHLFKYLSEIHSLTLPKVEITKKVKGEKIASQNGLPLYRLAQLSLEYSNNLMAEMLLFSTTGLPPFQGATKMKSWYSKQFEKLNWKNVELKNGSGLDLESKSSSRALTNWLAQVSDEVIETRSFMSYFSINGHSGGISRRLKNPNYAYRVYAKTGSFFYFNNLAGYLVGKSGKRYAFSIFTTDSEKRAMLNLKNSKAVNSVRQGAKSWKYKSNTKIDNLLKTWIDKY